MPRRRLLAPRPPRRRVFVYAEVTMEEHAIVTARAQREGLTMSDYIRRGINALALEEGDDAPLVEEKERRRRVTYRRD